MIERTRVNNGAATIGFGCCRPKKRAGRAPGIGGDEVIVVKTEAQLLFWEKIVFSLRDLAAEKYHYKNQKISGKLHAIFHP